MDDAVISRVRERAASDPEFRRKVAAHLTVRVKQRLGREYDAIAQRVNGRPVCEWPNYRRAYNHIPAAPTRISDVVAVTSRVSGIPAPQLRGQGRCAVLVYWRHIAMFVARTMVGATYPLIGREFGGRDHTSVMHAVRKVASDPHFAPDIALIKRGLPE